MHRDLKPENLLISVTTPVQMKISDLGFVKRTDENGCFSQSEIRGSRLWMAPEMLENFDLTCLLPKEMFAVDIYSMGFSILSYIRRVSCFLQGR